MQRAGIDVMTESSWRIELVTSERRFGVDEMDALDPEIDAVTLESPHNLLDRQIRVPTSNQTIRALSDTLALFFNVPQLHVNDNSRSQDVEHQHM